MSICEFAGGDTKLCAMYKNNLLSLADFRECINILHFLLPLLGSPIAESIQQTFLDDLLTSYQNMENTFLEKLLMLYKSFEFRSLWSVTDTLVGFQRTATEAAPGTGKLQGIVQLNKALQALESIEDKGLRCFTKFEYVTGTHKWSFDKDKNPIVCIQHLN